MSWLVAALMVVSAVIRDVRARRSLARRASEAAAALGAVETLSLELRCGSSPLEALQAVSVGSTEASLTLTVLGRAAAAATMSEAAGHLDDGSPELRALGAALRLAETAGTSLATLSDALAAPLRDQLRQDRELADALAGIKSSADLLTGLPLLGILLAAGVGARPLFVLFHTGLGAVCLDLGVGLASVGRWWTDRLIERARLAGRS